MAAAAPAAPRRMLASPATMTPDDFTVVARGLERPEGIAVAADGRVYISEGRSTVTILEVDGTLRRIGTQSAVNGVALDGRGRVVLANFGLLKNVAGSLQRIDIETGVVETLADRVNGRALVASNFPTVARDGTIYCTHSTWGPAANIGNREANGFVYSIDPGGRIALAAAGLRGPNGCCLDADERHLYVAQTAAGNVVRMERLADGRLGPPQTYGPVLGDVTLDAMAADIRGLPVPRRARLGYTDGIAFDAAGNLWVTLPFSNRIVAITPDGGVRDIVGDPHGQAIAMPTNLAWGGPDMGDLYVVSRDTGTVVRARGVGPGLALAGWRPVDAQATNRHVKTDPQCGHGQGGQRAC